MDYPQIVRLVADLLKSYDSHKPVHKAFMPGIGPFGEPQIVGIIATYLTQLGYPSKSARHPDLWIGTDWAIEFKIVRPYGDNGREAENWSVNLLHPYKGSTSLLGDALTLKALKDSTRKGLFIIGFEHESPKIDLNPLLTSFELLAEQVMRVKLGERIEETRTLLVHPEHQVLRCIGWELM